MFESKNEKRKRKSSLVQRKSERQAIFKFVLSSASGGAGGGKYNRISAFISMSVLLIRRSLEKFFKKNFRDDSSCFGFAKILALTIILTIITATETTADVISCVNGKYADGTDCQSCGSDCNWSYDTETKHLDVFGSGDMYDYMQHSGGACLDINGQEMPWIDKEIVSLNITGLNTVGRNAFVGQFKLKELTLDKTITELHPGAFQGTGLENATLPDSITDLGLYAFKGSRLKEIILTDSIVTIDHDAIVGTNNTNIVCKGADCEDIKTKLQQSGYIGKFSIAKDAKCNDANYYYTGSACIKEPDVTKRTCEYERTGYIKVGNNCYSPEVTYAKKHYTPAEANQWLKDDDNFVVLTFKK